MFDPDNIKLIKSRDELRNVFPFPPAQIYLDSVMTRLEKYSRMIIEKSSLVFLSSVGESGIKVSPRGGKPGFVRILDDQWLFMPDGKGNNKIENFENLLTDPRVGLLFMINGYDITLRATANAHITNDASLLDQYLLDGKRARIGTLFKLDSIYLHCGKAIQRSGLLDPATHQDPEAMPSVGTMLKSMIKDMPYSPEKIDEYVAGNK